MDDFDVLTGSPWRECEECGELYDEDENGAGDGCCASCNAFTHDNEQQ